MDSPVTIPILTSREIRVLHLESSDVCQAACPACARETDPNFDKSSKHNLSPDQLQSLLPQDVVQALDKMFMCGNYGDPAANHLTLRIYRWFRSINPNIVLGMNTNGGLQNTFWWHELAQILNQPRDYVVFSIDGLEDTNGDYRIGVQWAKVMANAEAFIAGGGSAHWDMLVYRHNEHQVNACERLARDMGFKWFRAKVSKRPLQGRLQIPITWQAPVMHATRIDCHALREQSVYIDARGRISPCCWLGSRQQDFVSDIKQVEVTWNTPTPNPTCVQACGVGDSQSNFQAQWRREVDLSKISRSDMAAVTT